jgi:hypothetical protein
MMKSPITRAATIILLATWAVTTRTLAQESYLAIDMVKTDLSAESKVGTAPQLLGDSPLLLVEQGPGSWYVRALTVSEINGAQLGSTLDIPFPPGPCTPPSPCDLLYSEYFLPGAVFVLSEDFSFLAFPLSFSGDGTPVAGSIVCSAPDPALAGLGTACGITEMPGSAFGDGMPRMFVGSASGNIAMFLPPSASAPVLEGVIDLLAGQPIAALEPIPQQAGLLLGAAVGDQIVGIINPDILPALQFTITEPHARPIRDFVAQNPGAPADPTYIAFSDGVHFNIPVAALLPDMSGTSTMFIFASDPDFPILTSPPSGLALGSLLMLTQDGQGVYYDPGYEIIWGSTYCLADVSDPNPAVCIECPIVLTGDVNLSSSITSADVIVLVNFIFKGGAPPQPCPAAGDVNCNGSLTSADVIMLVNFVFKSGPAPCNGCTSPLFPPC